MENGPSDLPIVHQHGNAPADADDQGHSQKVRAARHIGFGNLLLPHAVNEADDHAAHQKQGAELRKPPAQNRQRQAHLVKGDDAVDHHQKHQREEDHDNLALRCEHRLRLLHAHLDFARAHAHHGPGGIFLYPGGIGGDIPDGGALKHNPLEEAQHNAIPQGHPGKARGDAGGKGVDGGADDARSRSQQNYGNAHHGVIARRQKHGDQQGIKGHGLLPHAVGGAPQAEEQHQDGDEPLLPAPQPLDDAGHAGIHRAGLHHHA